MKLKRMVLISAALTFTASAFAQNAAKFEIFGDYSYMQFNTTLSGLQSRAFNGGGGGIQYNFNDFFGIKGDFQGYGSTTWTSTFANAVVTPKGTIPAGTYKSQGNMFTYLFGPTIGVHAQKVYFYGEFLMGGSNSTGYANTVTAIDAAGGTIPKIGSQHPFTLALGGGVDYNLSNVVSLRLAELDYVMTRYTNPITSTNNQNSFRYIGGVVFRFGGK